MAFLFPTSLTFVLKYPASPKLPILPLPHFASLSFFFRPPSSFVPFEISGFAGLAFNGFTRFPFLAFFFAACGSVMFGSNAASSLPAAVSSVPDLEYSLESGSICVRSSCASRCGLGWCSGSWSFSAGRGGSSGKGANGALRFYMVAQRGLHCAWQPKDI